MNGDRTIRDYVQNTEEFYLEQEIEEEEDNRKIFYTAVRKSDKERFIIHWSPYSYISQDDFRMIVELQLFNCRDVHIHKTAGYRISVNWDSDSLKKLYDNSPLFHRRRE